MQFERILHPTDCDDSSRPALAQAVALARRHGARLVIVHAVASVSPEKLTHGEALSQLQPHAHHRQLWHAFRRWALSEDLPSDVELILHEGDPVTVIARIAARKGSDLIVMAGLGRPGWRRKFFRSIPEHVMRRVACPVLVVKTAPTTEPAPSEEMPLHVLYLSEEPLRSCTPAVDLANTPVAEPAPTSVLSPLTQRNR